MSVYQLTQMGESLARTPSQQPTSGWRVLYFLRRHGGRATQEQISQFTGMGIGELSVTLGNLVRQKVITKIA